MIKLYKILHLFGLLVTGFLLPGSANATVALHPVFSEGMVLQRNSVIRFWGSASPNESVSISISGKTVESAADVKGKWEIEVGILPAGGPHKLVVSGVENQVEVSDILVGEVWICGGQSNMALGMSKILSKSEVSAASRPNDIRYLHIPLRRQEIDSNKEINLHWRAATAVNVGNFSAVCYLFGKQIQQHTGVPVGLISIAVGGSAAETWVGQHAMTSPAVRKSAEILGRMIDVQDRRFLLEHPDGRLNKDFYRRPSYRPTELFEMMVNPVAGYAARGVAWYQGESHRMRGRYYYDVLNALIRDWRDAWRLPKMPFLVVQLPSYGKVRSAMEPDSEMVAVREAQARVARNAEVVGMIVTLDCGGESIHPMNKQPIADRLARAARALAYGENITYSGPVYKTFTIRESSMVIEFSSYNGILVSKGDVLAGFFISGEDRRWVEAQAAISGGRVILHHESVPNPVAARYAWSEAPLATLFDSDGLPAGPFRTDDW